MRNNLAEKLSAGFHEGDSEIDSGIQSERQPILEKRPEYESAESYKNAVEDILEQSRQLLKNAQDSSVSLEGRSSIKPDKIDREINDLDAIKEKLFKLEAFGVNHAYPDSSEKIDGLEEILEGAGKLGEQINGRISEISAAIYNLQRIRNGMAINLKGEALPLNQEVREVPTKVAFSGGNTAPTLFEDDGRRSLEKKQEEAKMMPSWGKMTSVVESKPTSIWGKVKKWFAKN